MVKTILMMGAALSACLTTPLLAQDQASEAQEIDYAGFELLTSEVAKIRQERLLPLADFKAYATEPDTLILDTRSVAAFELGHIEGAVNLPFSDFTEDKLREVIGDNKDRKILIYCNNNFSDNEPPIRLKIASLALNIPTFINLIGYGYNNVWELGETVTTADVPWAGTTPMAQFQAEIARVSQASQQ